MVALTDRWATITKRPSPRLPPVVGDYDEAVRAFSWQTARRQLDGLPGGRGLNIAHEAVDRHAAGPRSDHDAIRWLARDGRRVTITYGELRRDSNRFAGVLRGLGVGRGDVVALLMARTPELYVAALGTWKAGAVLSPLFSAFGPEPLRMRLELASARVLVTTVALYEHKVADLRAALPALEHVLVVTDGGPVPGGIVGLQGALQDAATDFEIPPTDPDQPALLHFTSGTTGTPKGAVHVHEAVVAHHATARMALDLRPSDVFWCTADPGWVTGTSYGIIAPLTIGATLVVDEAEFDVHRWYRTLEAERVSVWYTAPTAVRMLMKAGGEVARGFDLSALRFVASVGEPLNPEGVVWGVEALGGPIHDNWWQTETGGIMIANLAGADVHPGSMGRSLPGVEAAVLRRGPHDEILRRGGDAVLADIGEEGELALRPGWPSMFRGYLHDEERYAKCFAGGWYLSGDLVTRDADGYYWFVGRGDDVIKSAGHLIGPFEVESVLLEHPAVAEAGVIGVPDATVGQVVKAFVDLKPGYEPGPEMERELRGFARSRLGAAVAPRTIAFERNLPKTKSGKIMRRLLRARELGLPEGDLSTLEAPP